MRTDCRRASRISAVSIGHQNDILVHNRRDYLSQGICVDRGQNRTDCRAAAARDHKAPCRMPIVGEIRQVITDSRFHGENYRKVWARLRYKGIGNLTGAGSAAHARERAVCEAMPRASTRSSRP